MELVPINLNSLFYFNSSIVSDWDGVNFPQLRLNNILEMCLWG